MYRHIKGNGGSILNSIAENIREYSQGDEREIINLHREVFHSDLDIARWNWQFMDGHPRGKSWINVAQSGLGVVGHYCIMRHHLNYNGVQLTAGQSCDTMVRSDQRGKKLFIKLAASNYELAKNNGAQAVFGFPNRKSYPGLMRHLDWVRLVNLDYYYYVLGCKKVVGSTIDSIVRKLFKFKIILERKIRLLTKSAEYEIITTEQLPSDVGDLLLEINTYEVLSIWKDFDYLRWRYEKHPGTRYLFHLLKYNGAYESIIVTKTENQETHICEVLSRSKNQILTLILLYHAIIHAINNKAQKIDFHGYDNGFFSCLFDYAGFKKGKSNFVLCGKTFSENKKLHDFFCLPNNWTISVGDIDVF